MQWLRCLHIEQDMAFHLHLCPWESVGHIFFNWCQSDNWQVHPTSPITIRQQLQIPNRVLHQDLIFRVIVSSINQYDWKFHMSILESCCILCVYAIVICIFKGRKWIFKWMLIPIFYVHPLSMNICVTNVLDDHVTCVPWLCETTGHDHVQI